DRLAQRCLQLQLAPERLILELTETSAMDDPVASLGLITRLRMKGFHLSIDDFGTGFSSMLQLVRLPFSELKVDKSFVMTALQSEESRTVVKSIVDLGRSLGLRTVAEGVETAEVFDFLRKIGCDQAQGYHIARPMTGDATLRWMREHAAAR
ncbi:EAL domain-containing protein, partial [Arthrospira platensis SPKY1]|nr:EAL domain-containing protein [Arthrospira platensis SPKY1]